MLQLGAALHVLACKQCSMQSVARGTFGGSSHVCCSCCCRCCPVTLGCSADGLAQQFLTNLAKLKAAKDCVLDLCATLSLWLLSSEDANPCYLASVAAAVLLDQLLQVCCTCIPLQ